jgi:hypothetical protein
VRGIKRLGEPRQIGPNAVDPHRVCIDKEERRRPKQRQRLDDAAAGAEHLVTFIGDGHAGPGAAGDMIDDLVGQIMDIDDRFADTGVAELVEHMIEQRATRYLHQRLWHLIGQRAHTQAESGGENHGFSGFDGHCRSFSTVVPGVSRKRG